MKRPTALSVLTIAALLGTACLLKETTHTLYLDPDGTVSWVVIEKDVRSEADDPAERRAEEAEYLAAFAAGQHDVARALNQLGAERLRTRWLRERRPYATLTEADFASLETLVRELVDQLAIPAEVELTHEGSEHHLVVKVRIPAEDEEEGDVAEESEILLSLIEDLEAYRLVLTAGQFTAAEGFELQDDDTAAVFEEPGEEEMGSLAGGVLTLRLSWTACDPP